MFDYDFNETVPEGELLSKLEQVGVIRSYETWNEKLTESGFIRRKIFEDVLLEQRTVWYYYLGDFSVKGEHADDVFNLLVVLNKDGISIEYISSKFIASYLGINCEDESIKYPKGLVKAKDFLDKSRYLIGGYAQHIKIDVDGIFRIVLNNDSDENISSIKGSFIKLAVLLDRELQRRYPFDSVKDYEANSRQILSDNMKYFESFNADEKTLYSGSLSCYALLNTVIMSSYNITQAEAIEKFYEAVREIRKLIEKQIASADDNRMSFYRRFRMKSAGRQYFDEDEITSAVDEIREMSSEEFEAFKDKLFDL